MTLQILKSEEDASVNFVRRLENGDVFESRYVRREDEYIIAYLSSHAGCDKACRFCHLTQTGQTSMTEASVGNYRRQAEDAVGYWWANLYNEVQPERVNYNFMARGEPLANKQFMGNWRKIAKELYMVNWRAGIHDCHYNVSTIMPQEAINYDLASVFGKTKGLRLYYSLYSMQERFRKRWLPKALDPNIALDKLAEYQQKTGGEIALHWAFIKDQNDDLETLEQIVEAVKQRDIEAKFNLVRYNPYSHAQGVEPSDDILQRNFEFMRDAFGHEKSRIVPRVGHDVKASCGMFVNG